MKVLVLDDDKTRLSQFRDRFIERGYTYDTTTSMEDCWKFIESKKYDMIFLDHDLGDEVFVDSKKENTGSEIARRWGSKEHKNKETKVIVHSFNPAGAKNMLDLIEDSIYIPGIWVFECFEKYDPIVQQTE